MIDWIVLNWLELLGFVSALIYLFFSVKQHVWVWPWGIITSAAYVFFYLESRLYAIGVLNVYYVAVSFYGWYNWRKGNPESDGDLPVTRVRAKDWLAYLLAGSLLTLGMYVVLSRYTDSPVPWADSFITALSVLATWMLTKKKLENWLLWLVADSFAVAIYFEQKLFLTAILFVIYSAMTLVGYRAWRKTMRV